MPPKKSQKQEEKTSTTEPTGEYCDECEGKVIYDEESNEKRCATCGIVIKGEIIDRGPEWRHSSESEEINKSRVGGPITETIADRGISTSMRPQKYDAYGNLLSHKKRKQMARLREKHKWASNDGSDRRLDSALQEIKRMGVSLSLPKSVIEMAAVVQRRIHSSGLLPGRSLEASASASIYIACKMEHISRRFEEIERVSRVGKKEIKRMFSYTQRELDIEIPLSTPEEFIPRFASKIEANSEHEREANRILIKYKENGNPSGNAPSVLAAASLYAAGITLNNIIPQNIIAEAACVNKCSVRENYKLMLKADPTIDTKDCFSAQSGYTHPANIAQKIHDINTANYLTK